MGHPSGIRHHRHNIAAALLYAPKDNAAQLRPAPLGGMRLRNPLCQKQHHPQTHRPLHPRDPRPVAPLGRLLPRLGLWLRSHRTQVLGTDALAPPAAHACALLGHSLCSRPAAAPLGPRHVPCLGNARRRPRGRLLLPRSPGQRMAALDALPLGLLCPRIGHIDPAAAALRVCTLRRRNHNRIHPRPLCRRNLLPGNGPHPRPGRKHLCPPLDLCGLCTFPNRALAQAHDKSLHGRHRTAPGYVGRPRLCDRHPAPGQSRQGNPRCIAHVPCGHLCRHQHLCRNRHEIPHHPRLQHRALHQPPRLSVGLGLSGGGVVVVLIRIVHIRGAQVLRRTAQLHRRIAPAGAARPGSAVDVGHWQCGCDSWIRALCGAQHPLSQR
eukprot:comp5562_c0_seq1/m.4944 comp5562_c0_seq1/g.4944  ORF comp5562_c0_seq1/g.4944 comp5562_c0_seq1/m.4944 type:complete len:380 (+) comp5562_c0_seq1:1580-2719(+)